MTDLDLKYVMGLPPLEWQAWANDMSMEEREAVARTMDRVAERAAALAAYLEARHGAGCGDQGHDAAVKASNRAAGIVWCKALGYNEHLDLSI